MLVKRIYYWVGLTVAQPFNTGVQRVTRCLAASLQRQGVEIVPVKWDHASSRMAPVTQEEADNLAKWSGPKLTPPATLPDDLRGEWLMIPEITYPVVPHGSNVAKLGKDLGMRVAAIFYDMIPAKTPEIYSDDTLKNLSEYWGTFKTVDLTLPISHTVKPDLVEWLKDKMPKTQIIAPVQLAGEIPDTPRSGAPGSYQRPFNFLAIGTWEPRKNYPRIIRALLAARRDTSQDIRLTIVGRKAKQTFPKLHAEITSLASTAGDNVVQLNDHLTDGQIGDMYKRSQATIFGSWIEGFGLPVLESLWHGRPCICHNGSALAEVAPGGGTIMLNMQNEDEIASGISNLVTSQSLYTKLADEAVSRPIKTWAEYGDNVLSAINSIETIITYDPLG